MKVLRGAGWGNTSGDANVCLGYQAGKNYTTESNQLVIGNSETSELIYGEFDNEIVKLNATVTTTKATYTSAVETARTKSKADMQSTVQGHLHTHKHIQNIQ